MVVQWNQQARLIEIKPSDNIQTIEQAIIEIYQTNEMIIRSQYQIQFYHHKFGSYLDLYPEVLPGFQNMLSELLSSQASLKSDKRRFLRIIAKAIPINNQSIHESTVEDTYTYQQDNDATQLIPTDNSLSSNNDQAITVPPKSPIEPTVPRCISWHDNENTVEHRYSFCFEQRLAETQRAQFEREMLRKSANTKTTSVAGTLLRDKSDEKPTLHFQIPPDDLGFDWRIRVYILTQPDNNGIHYLHASKSIFHHHPNSSENDATELENPYTVQLQQDDLRNGKYVLRLKVCNIPGLNKHRERRLRIFPALNNEISLSDKTTDGLDFQSDIYHVGCVLVRENRACDQCISSATSATREQTNGASKRKKLQQSS
ncbi:unnamed protein product [Adineta ricciae]|uniref:Uncharacterized protein n=1 Tax=Adineta ricciae TaxID=249248 RepID=A0A813RIQ9_ADIRI|nr:unnamed protein product [Adineta ricciae]CAF1585334.1 unnamed protein product [Adineta ricciae]